MTKKEEIIEVINNIYLSKYYKNIKDLISSDESSSLLSGDSRAFLYTLIIKLGLNKVLEIGTYFGGGTKNLANAVLKNNGNLITLDPSKDRKKIIEKEISSWDDELKKLTFFFPLTSSDFFLMKNYAVLDQGIWFDLLIIDGDHSYTGAFSDLLNCSQYAGPNGIIIVDDYNQPPVYNAVKDFLKINSNWQEINNSISSDAIKFSKITPSIKNLPFLILIGPENPSINQNLTSIGKNILGTVKGINLNLAKPCNDGILESRWLISIMNDDKSISMKTLDCKKEIKSGRVNINLNLPYPITSSKKYPMTIDTHLVWNDKVTNNLELSSPPKYVVQ
ncbi:MAG: hypothetical protein CFH01_01426 [Alphaproteobacteria bacterium MarineAlpha2_Bin1]|nr:MAG: hypothetical protein CFH01_01426 [Alphaproteobacteria bacterium MarineAlpha2_Bin1]